MAIAIGERMTKIKNISGIQGVLCIPAQQLPLTDSRPILEVLRPVRIEQWRMEGLFRRGKFSVFHKIRFVGAIRARAFDHAHRAMSEARGDSRGVSPIEIAVDKRLTARRMFDAVSDEKIREVMRNMIVAENLQTARYTAKKAGYVWQQFVFDFNYGLEQMMEQQERSKENATRSI